ncbi:MAG: hypothetical protein HYS04_03905 [Acidobacteria bacterium]|nr:hypothetical protein [Acidobacteriota bacterium]
MRAEVERILARALSTTPGRGGRAGRARLPGGAPLDFLRTKQRSLERCVASISPRLLGFHDPEAAVRIRRLRLRNIPRVQVGCGRCLRPAGGWPQAAAASLAAVFIDID